MTIIVPPRSATVIPLPPVPDPAAAQAAVNLIKSSNPKIAYAIQKTIDYSKAVYAARNSP